MEPNLWSRCYFIKLWTVYMAGLPGLRRAAAGDLPESPEDSEGEGAEADTPPEGAGESWSRVSETQQSEGGPAGGTR